MSLLFQTARSDVCLNLGDLGCRFDGCAYWEHQKLIFRGSLKKLKKEGSKLPCFKNNRSSNPSHKARDKHHDTQYVCIGNESCISALIMRKQQNSFVLK